MPVTTGPSAIVTSVGSTSFSVQVTGISGMGGTTIYLGTRPLGSNQPWSDNGYGSPVIGHVLTVTGLTPGAPLEWRVQETAGSTMVDGTHGVICPNSSIWPTMTAAVQSVLGSAGIAAGNIAYNGGVVPYSDVYIGQFWPANVPERAALIKTSPERVLRYGNNIKLLCYSVTLHIQLKETSDVGSSRKTLMEQIQNSVREALDQEGPNTYPSIPGLEIIQASIRSKDEMIARDDDILDYIRGTMDIEFEVWESRA